ncbi:MarR family winged helix-turn-helix transcriptional regulator [Psychrobacillus sp. NPDC093180]|uniref:MarR family winged helix-turn-helix transcriptional regulator n=1 Tax=Psychrobacillus sp. NPDC093180 TaxID=3364489 RepID=UPI003818FD2F
MNNPEQLIHTWVNFSKFHNRITKSLDQLLQQKYQLNLNEFYLLMFLNENEEKKLPLSQLQNMVGLSQSALSRLVSRLEQHHFHAVERVSYAGDKRSVYVLLTPRGQQYIDEIMMEVNVILQHSLSIKDIKNLSLFAE